MCIPAVSPVIPESHTKTGMQIERELVHHNNIAVYYIYIYTYTRVLKIII